MRAFGAALTILLVGATCKIRVPPAGSEETGDFPCDSADECPAPPNACLLSACWDGQCVYVPAPEGSLPPTHQIAGDCKERLCDGHGAVVTARAMRDLPPDDDNPCTDAICDLDVPKQAPRIAGSRCGEGICNGAGICGVCLPTERRCEGQAIATCGPDGAWSEPSPCATLTPRCHEALCVGVVEIAAAAASACARFSDGSVMCWGAPVGLPGTLPGGRAGFDDVALGPRHGCGVRAGEIACWGAGDWGQIGDGRLTSSPSPIATGLRGTQIAVGRDHGCAIGLDGRVSCWGRNDRGQCGQPAGAGPRPSPDPPAVAVPSGQPRPAPLVAGEATGLALSGPEICVRAGARTDCWGAPRYALPIDLDPDDPANAPALAARRAVSVTTPAGVAGLVADAIGCGHHHCCARRDDGTVRCWGAGARGELGQGTADSAVPLTVPGVVARRLAVGGDFACALTAEDEVLCWGDGARGQLGREADGPAGPGRVPLPAAAIDLVAGDDFACALTAGGEVRCWGDGAADPGGLAVPPAAVAW